MKKIHIKLDLEDFRCLVRGGILSVTDNENNIKTSIILSDIGFINMEEAIYEAESGKQEHYKNLDR